MSMNQPPKDGLNELRDIRNMMEKSSRFISLSGWSGIAAGVCAVGGAIVAGTLINCQKGYCIVRELTGPGGEKLERDLYIVGGLTFITAFASAFFFTWVRSKKTGVPVWGRLARKLMWSVALPMIAGAAFLFRMIQLEYFEMIAPGCLLFYGIALVNASRYTLNEIRYLGYAEIALGLINAWCLGYGLYFWAIGFGLLHIIYGIVMWYRYERTGR